MEKSREAGEGRGLATGPESLSGSAAWDAGGWLTAGRRRWLGALLGGGLSALAMIAAFPRGAIPEAAYVALLPFTLWLFYARPTRRWVLWNGFATGMVQWAVLLWWLRHFPEQVGLSPAWGYLGWIMLSAVLGCFWMVWGWWSHFVWKRVGEAALGWRLLGMTGVAAGWVLLEWVRHWLFSGFPWLPLAASQWDRPLLLQILAFTGAWGLSFILVLFNLGLAFYVRQLLRGKRRPWYRRFCLEFYVGLAGVFLAIGLGVDDLQQRPNMEMFRAAFVQPYVKPPERWDANGQAALIARYEEDLREPVDVVQGLREAGAEDRDWLEELTPQIILWPEASTPFPAPGHPATEAWLEDLVRDLEVPVVMGNLARTVDAEGEARWYNAVIAIDPETGIDPHFVAKRKLVPFGEAMPGWLPFLDKLIPVAGSFTPGEGDPILPVEVAGHRWRIAPLVCYEDLFPGVARKAVARGADLLLVVTNDAWYGEESAAYQHMVHSVLRAVETRRPVLRAGNAGWSGWIDERGYIRAVVTDPETGSIYTRTSALRKIGRSSAFFGRTSVYVRWGDWFVALCALLFGATVAALIARGPAPAKPQN